ncbi:MAG: DUF2214 family protein [Cytophagales bacterium]|nr:DUF2214 family protein [Cytophagales bacterium]
MLYLIFRYVHFLAIFTVVSTVFAENVLIRRSLPRQEVARLARIDGLYGIAAILTLLVGLLLWFAVGKPAEFYSRNWIFHAKLTLFTLVGLLSIYPTIFFPKNRKGESDTLVELPPSLIIMVRLELLVLVLVPLLAVLMVQGIGSF